LGQLAGDGKAPRINGGVDRVAGSAEEFLGSLLGERNDRRQFVQRP